MSPTINLKATDKDGFIAYSASALVRCTCTNGRRAPLHGLSRKLHNLGSTEQRYVGRFQSETEDGKGGRGSDDSGPQGRICEGGLCGLCGYHGTRDGQACLHLELCYRDSYISWISRNRYGNHVPSWSTGSGISGSRCIGDGNVSCRPRIDKTHDRVDPNWISTSSNGTSP